MALPKASEARKAIVAVLSLVGVVLTVALAQGDVIPAQATKWVVLTLAVLNAVGVYRVPNDRAPGTPEAVANRMSVRETPNG